MEAAEAAVDHQAVHPTSALDGDRVPAQVNQILGHRLDHRRDLNRDPNRVAADHRDHQETVHSEATCALMKTIDGTSQEEQEGTAFALPQADRCAS